jgi:hypothetical protein
MIKPQLCAISWMPIQILKFTLYIEELTICQSGTGLTPLHIYQL